ncbi:MAG: DUF2924 domain-containing protein [Polyangiaceae bacterium]|nr:DUF2924 domain-containing protein [Polyangiaceae bacterium]
MMTTTLTARHPDEPLQEQLQALDTLTVPQLRARYREVFGEDTRTHNGPYLRKRIGYRLQERAEGGLSDRAKARIRELAKDSPIRRRGVPVGAIAAAPEPAAEPPAAKRDPRLPPAGTTFKKKWGDREHVVKVGADAFTYGGEQHASLSKIARLITGTNWNGFAFFGLTKPWGKR